MPDISPVPDSTAAQTCSPFTCRYSADGFGAVWIHAGGELDPSTAPQLESRLREAQVGARLVVLDLRELTFLDSRGVQVIMDAGIRLRREGARMIVVRAPRQVDKVFMLLGVTGDVEILDLAPAQPTVQALLQHRRDA